MFFSFVFYWYIILNLKILNLLIIKFYDKQKINKNICKYENELFSFDKLFNILLLIPDNKSSYKLDLLLEHYFEYEIVTWIYKWESCKEIKKATK